jgi:dCTP deaminase
MTVQGRGLIEERLSTAECGKRLFITPILERDQIGEASVDIRLGYDFVTIRRGNVGLLDPAQPLEPREKFRTPHHLNRKDPFYLHPNEMSLASTLEYVRLPQDLSAYVTSRSRWGRLGLIIATAIAIHPGFAGTITLELVNHGSVPMVLYPGLDVAQLVLHSAAKATPYDGQLASQTGPHTVDPMGDDRRRAKFWFPSQ